MSMKTQKKMEKCNEREKCNIHKKGCRWKKVTKKIITDLQIEKNCGNMNSTVNTL